MNTNNTQTGAGNTTAAQLFSDCINHLQFVCGKTKDEALDIMSEGAAGVVFQAEISNARNTRRPIKVTTCYTTADENGVAVIGAKVTWNDGECGEMTWPNMDAFCAFQGRYYRF